MVYTFLSLYLSLPDDGTIEHISLRFYGMYVPHAVVVHSTFQYQFDPKTTLTQHAHKEHTTYTHSTHSQDVRTHDKQKKRTDEGG